MLTMLPVFKVTETMSIVNTPDGVTALKFQSDPTNILLGDISLQAFGKRNRKPQVPQ